MKKKREKMYKKELKKSNRNVCILLHACKCGYAAAAEHKKICTQSFFVLSLSCRLLHIYRHRTHIVEQHTKKYVL